MNPHLHQLLTVQGDLLDKFLAQNLGQRYGYLIIAVPDQGPLNVAGATNFRDDPLVDAFLAEFSRRLHDARPHEIVEVNPHATVHELRYG